MLINSSKVSINCCPSMCSVFAQGVGVFVFQLY